MKTDNKYKNCEACQQTWYQCVCPAVDKFFEDADSLRPFDQQKPKAPVYDFSTYRLTREIRKL